jgi:hypothetical protein
MEAEQVGQDVAVIDSNAIDHLASIISTDTLMASQFNDMRRRTSGAGDEGIMRLWVAVLEDGIRCFLGDGVPAPDGNGASWPSRRSRLQNEAREWIFESDDGGPFSFIGLCEALGIGGDYLRERLAKRGDVRIPRKAPVSNGFRMHRNAMGRL